MEQLQQHHIYDLVPSIPATLTRETTVLTPTPPSTLNQYNWRASTTRSIYSVSCNYCDYHNWFVFSVYYDSLILTSASTRHRLVRRSAAKKQHHRAQIAVTADDGTSSRPVDEAQAGNITTPRRDNGTHGIATNIIIATHCVINARGVTAIGSMYDKIAHNTRTLAMKEAVYCANMIDELGFRETFNFVLRHIGNTSVLHVVWNRNFSSRAKHTTTEVLPHP